MPVTSISKHVYESVKLKFTAVTVSSLIYYWMIIYVNGIVHLKTILSLLNSCWYEPIWLSSTEYKRRFLELDCVNHFFIFIKLEKKTAWAFCKTSLFEFHGSTWGFWVNKPLKTQLNISLCLFFSLQRSCERAEPSVREEKPYATTAFTPDVCQTNKKTALTLETQQDRNRRFLCKHFETVEENLKKTLIYIYNVCKKSLSISLCVMVQSFFKKSPADCVVHLKRVTI